MATRYFLKYIFILPIGHNESRFTEFHPVFSPSSGVPIVAVLSSLHLDIVINSALSVFYHANIFIFADDMKLFLCIDSIANWIRLQEDFYRLVKWGESLGLFLNKSKWCSLFYSRRRSHISFIYHIKNLQIASASESVRDLKFTLTSIENLNW